MSISQIIYPEIKNKTERLGTILLLCYAILGGLFPIFGKIGVAAMPPLLFAGSSVFIAGIIVFFIDYWQRGWKLAHLSRTEWKKMLLNAIFNMVIPFILYFIGAQYTSGINAALLLRSEIIFTVLMTPLFGEPTTRLKLVGAGSILLGSVIVLYNNSLSFNIGDLLIFLAPLTYPLGNWYAKTALKTVSPSTVLFARSLIGGALLLMFSLILETAQYQTIQPSVWPYVLLNAVLVFTIGKLLFFNGLRHLDISKAIMLVNMEPLFSVVFALILLGETLAWQQFLGILVMMVGVLFTLKRRSIQLAKVI